MKPSRTSVSRPLSNSGDKIYFGQQCAMAGISALNLRHCDLLRISHPLKQLKQKSSISEIKMKPCFVKVMIVPIH